MGKSLQKEESGITLKTHGASCMWGLFHHLQQNQWHKVVKRLPHARFVYGKRSHSHHPHTHGQERATTYSNLEEETESDNDDDHPSTSKPPAGPKHAEHSPAHKHSVKSRIKAFTEEVYKKKGRHRRSTSYPVRKPPDENLPSHHKGKSTDINNNNSNNSLMPPIGVEGCSTPTALPESSHSMRLNYLKQNEVDQLGQVRDHTILHGNSMYAIEPSTGDSFQESKLFMDALNLLNLREEMFMKILKDPSLSLATQLQCRRSPNLRYGLNKSMSFSASATSDVRDFDVECSRKRPESSKGGEADVGNIIRRTDEEIASSSSSSPSPSTVLRKSGDERVGIMRFKNIREKIKYVIRDRKKEKNRIMMDALHHRVPYGMSPSKKLAEDAEQVASEFGRSPTQEYKRTASFDHSLDRYKQLIDVGSSNEGKDRRSDDQLKVNVQPVIGMKPAALKRILSLPEIRSNIKSLNAGVKEEKRLDSVDEEDRVESRRSSDLKDEPEIVDESRRSSTSSDSKDEPEIVDESRRSSTSSDSKDEHESTVDGSRRSCTSSDSKDEHETIDGSRRGSSTSDSEDEDETTVDGSRRSTSDPEEEDETVDGSRRSTSDSKDESEALELGGEEKDGGVEEVDASLSDDSRISENPKTATQGEDDEEPNPRNNEAPPPEHELYDSSCIASSPQGAVGIIEESQIQQFYNDLLHVQGEKERNKPEFKYVKGVLELSGFSKNKTLGKWHSSENPLNPLVFEEAGGWCSAQCCSEEGAIISNQLLLFDLINEVLLHIHERSFCFWPTPLTSRSSVHPLPKGSRVLEEVWTEIKWLLSTPPEAMDDAVSRDLGKNDGWMNLQLDAECVGLEMEELIFDDLVQEIFD